MRPLVKICGLTRPEDARLAVDLGATHVGAILAETSARRVSPETARELFAAAGPTVRHVLVFKGAPVSEAVRLALEIAAAHVALYDGSEEDALAAEGAGLTVYRVYSVSAEARALPRFSPRPTPESPAVLDTGGGGSGQAFPWRLLGRAAPDATFIAGGITPDNVAALLEHRPYGLDVSSGVESSPGIKDPAKLELFFKRLETTG